MTMTYKTIAGTVTLPGSDIGVRVKLRAIPLTTDTGLKFTDDNRITVGPVAVETNGTGVIPASFKVPTNVDVGELYWRIEAELIDKLPGAPKKWVIKRTAQITGTGTVQLRNLTEIDTLAVDAQILVNISDLVTDAEDARDDAESAELGAQDAQAAAETAQTAAAGSATTASTQAGVATAQAGIATTKAGEAASSAAAADASADAAAADLTTVEGLVGAAEAVAVSNDTIIAGRINDGASATAAALSASYVGKEITKAAGLAPTVIREVIDPNRTASKWREIADTNLFATTHHDPVYFFGWNADKMGGGGDASEPSIYMGFEADYWDSSTTRTMEWYIGVVRADASGPQFRPFAFTAARDSNSDLTASVQIDIGTGAKTGSAPNRSQFQVVQGGGSPIVTVAANKVEIPASVVFRKSQNATSLLQQLNAAGNAYVDVALVDSEDSVMIAPAAGRTRIGGVLSRRENNVSFLQQRNAANSGYIDIALVDASNQVVLGPAGAPVVAGGGVFGVTFGADALSMRFDAVTARIGRIAHNGKGANYTSGIFTQNVSGTDYHALGVNSADNSAALTVQASDATLKGIIARGRTSQSGNLFEAQDSSSTTLWAITPAGIPKFAAAGNAQTTVGAAGAASALPATPTKYLKVVDSAGTTLVIPAYAAS